MAGRLLHEAEVRVIAVGDSRACVRNERGLDIPALIRHKDLTGNVAGFPGAEEIETDDMLALPCDVLVPAALENSIHRGNAGKVKAKIIAEAANGPLTPEADRIVDDAGAFVLPDILCNAGGVTVSYFEWVQDREAFFWTLEEINARLRRIMTRAFDDTLHMSREHEVDLRTAAYMLAVGRVAEATLTRGIYP